MIFEKVMTHPLIQERPPVLVDVGASSEIPAKWRKIAKYSICIAFDPDSRLMEHFDNEKGFKKLHIYPAIVHGTINGESDFYLTASPECSSTLEPDTEKLSNYYFAPFFEVEKKVKLPAVTIPKVLEKLELDYIDWYKSDSQGTDLRIFNSLDKDLMNNIIAAEFEPGIIDAYHGEDKLWKLISYMEPKAFWCCECNILGSSRISSNIAGKNFSGVQKKLLNSALPTAPGWAEISYLNDFSNMGNNMRGFLLGWAFAKICGHHGEALRLAELASSVFEDEIFAAMAKDSRKSIVRSFICGKGIWKKIFNKLNVFKH